MMAAGEEFTYKLDSCHFLLISLLSVALMFQVLNLQQNDSNAQLPPYTFSEEGMKSSVTLQSTKQGDPKQNETKLINSCICHQTSSNIKVFNVGLPKSGTLSLQKLLESMGCSSIHYKVKDMQQLNLTRLNITNSTAYHQKWHVGKLMQKAFENDKPLLYYFADDVNGVAQMDWCGGEHSDCIYPQIMYYQLLNQQYPNSLFILLRRNITKHIQSIDNWNHHEFRKTFVIHNIPFLPKGKGATNEEMRDWMLRIYDNLTTYFSQFSDRFLEFNLENDKDDALKEFLGCYGNYTMPHEHNTALQTHHRHKH